MTKEEERYQEALMKAYNSDESSFNFNGKKYETDQARRFTPTQMVVAPFSTGAFEGLTMIPEMFMLRSGLLKLKSKPDFTNKYADLFSKNLDKQIGEKVFGFTGGLTKYGSYELTQEISTQAGQNWTERVILGDKSVGYADGINTDFLIKVVGSTGFYTQAPRALQGGLMMLDGMYLNSDQEIMQKNSLSYLDVRNKLIAVQERIEQLSPKDPAFKKLKDEEASLQVELSKAEGTMEAHIYKVISRFGQMDEKSVEKLRGFAKKGAELQQKAREIRASYKNGDITKSEMKTKLETLQNQFQEIENNKAKIINNKSKYKLEHGNRINYLEKKAVENLKNKNKGKEPTKEQIEAEAERIFDKENANSDRRVNEAKRAVADNIKKFEAETMINLVNKLDPTLPIEKFEATTLEEAREWLRKNLEEKGLNRKEIDGEIAKLTEASWSEGKDGASAYIFQPKKKNSKADPNTGQFEKHQIQIINAIKAKAGNNWTARGHEIFHAIVYKALKASGKAFKPIAESLLNDLEQTDSKGYAWLMGEVNERIKEGKGPAEAGPAGQGRMKSYVEDDGSFTDDYYEEVVMAIADGMRRGRVKRTGGMISNIRKGFSKALKGENISQENQDLLINDSQDMLDLISNYTKDLEKGELSSDLSKFIKGEVSGELVDQTTQEQKKINEETRGKYSMDFLSKPARQAMNAANDAARSVSAGVVNKAYQDYIDGKIDSFTALNIIGGAYDSMFNKAIKHFENENNITFDEFEKEEFKFEALHSSRGIRGSLFKDANKPNKKVYQPAEGRTPARYLNGLLPQRMIEFGIKAIPSLEEKFAEDVTAMKNLEAVETAEMTIGKEVETKRDTRDLSDIDIINEDVISKIKKSITSIVTKGLSLGDSTQEILDEINIAIEKEYNKAIVKLMGTINSEGDRVIPSEEYKAFHATNFETIVKGLPIATIKKKYSKLFNITQIGREKDKKVDPVTGKVTYPGKGIFEIKPIPKAQFCSYFLNGKLTTLRARQKALATEIAQSLAKDATYEIAKDPEVIAKIQQMQETQGTSIAFGVANEIRNIANELDKKKTEKASLDNVKFSKDFGKLSEDQKDNLLNGLKEFGDIAAKYDAKTAFEEVYGKDKPFGKYTESILSDLTDLVQMYAIAKETYIKFDKQIPLTIDNFITDELKAADDLQAIKDILALTKGSLDFQNLKQLEDARKAVKVIVDKIGVDKALRFFPFLYSTGRIGGTSAIQGKHGLERRGADYWINKINKEQAKEKPSEAKINKYIKQIQEGREPIKHPYALFASVSDFTEFLKLPKNYKSKIPANAAQNVGKVNKNFNYKNDKESAVRNKKFLKELADIMIQLEKDGTITKNDIGMIQMALGNGGMSTPIAAAAQVQYMTDDGPKTSSKHIYEHLIPRKVINAAMTGYISGVVAEDNFTKLLDNFSVAVIPRDQADIVDQYYKSSMPSNWDLTQDPLDRYFNMLTFGSVNMPLINLETGKINTKSESYSNIGFKNNVKHSKDFKTAIENARTTSKETRGITILDFDDTLATTKSGVRVTMQNMDGLPKPGRKVIFLAGGAGSGKSSVINKLRLQDQGFKIVN